MSHQNNHSEQQVANIRKTSLWLLALVAFLFIGYMVATWVSNNVGVEPESAESSTQTEESAVTRDSSVVNE